MQLHHDFAQNLPHLVRPTEGEEQPNPEMVILNEELAMELGLDPDWLRSSEGMDFLTGRAGGHAMAYSGFQFGAFNPQMGDGRAMLMGRWIRTGGYGISMPRELDLLPFPASGPMAAERCLPCCAST